MDRPIHYAAHGRGGLTFPCYHAEMQAHMASPIRLSLAQQRLAMRGYHPDGYHIVPMPRGHTDLRRVTCSACWTAIRAMARERGAA